MWSDWVLQLISNNHARALGAGTSNEQHDPSTCIWIRTLDRKKNKTKYSYKPYLQKNKYIWKGILRIFFFYLIKPLIYNNDWSSPKLQHPFILQILVMLPTTSQKNMKERYLFFSFKYIWVSSAASSETNEKHLDQCF